ncbi:5-amino-6-(5-phosphoribosylamino)uracil reductase [Pigmentiphaga aceris]|uniref:5-amino-6-(5-phosphoribosylamino)uracil reductase n=1 Tax=Pigmentiphaga aceris TaxID=1940612 RepID=A0A5C0AW18_9BURK|nr:dihydrofolate reductase family protein [Pigmentiphaga aceris]QEI06579.1 5-amino-6-(5-phosphoribosylamino)uracil reductase [Pigmentiphaga aceris]
MRPKIICHMVSSIDGRLLPSRWTPPAKGVSFDVSAQYEAVAARIDAKGFIIGRTTMAEFSVATEREPTLGQAVKRDAHQADRQGKDLSVVIDPKGKLHYSDNTASGGHILAVLSEKVSDAYLQALRTAGVSYCFAGEDGDDLHLAMDTLGQVFGAKAILLEGGGRINGAFLKAGLIDEVSLLVTASIDGLAGVPSIFDYAGEENEKPAAGQSLRHVATETLEGGTVWMRYQVEKAEA